MEELTCGSRAELAVWGQASSSPSQRLEEPVCLPVPGWALLSCLHPPGSFLNPHQCGRDTLLSSCTYQHPCPQEQSIQDFSPAGPDLCLIRADRSPREPLTRQVSKKSIGTLLSRRKSWKGSQVFFIPHTRTRGYQAWFVFNRENSL